MISVIIPARNAERTIGEQLDALRNQTYRGEWELIVVDNDSTDATREWAVRGGANVVDAHKRGAAHARNVGAQHARGDYLLFVDADDRVRPDWLETMATATDNDFITGRCVPFFVEHDGREIFQPDGDDRETRVFFLPFASSANMGMRASLFHELGGFDEKYRAAEDMELSWRAQLASYPLAFVDAKVEYRYASRQLSTARNARQMYRYAQGATRLAKNYRQHGMPSGGSLRWFVRDTARAIVKGHWGSRDGRTVLARDLAYRAGCVVGSIRYWHLYLAISVGE